MTATIPVHRSVTIYILNSAHTLNLMFTYYCGCHSLSENYKVLQWHTDQLFNVWPFTWSRIQRSSKHNWKDKCSVTHNSQSTLNDQWDSIHNQTNVQSDSIHNQTDKWDSMHVQISNESISKLVLAHCICEFIFLILLCVYFSLFPV